MGEDAVIAGFAPQGVQSCLETLNAFCQQDCPIVISSVSVQQVKTDKGDLATEIAKILGVDTSIFDDPTKTLEDIGVDSFAKVELKHLIDTNTHLNVTLDEVRRMSMRDIKALIEKVESKGTEAAPLFASDHV
ncbi:hypothetical protein AVEN_47693-1, partial [Araneus ventricosus]